MVEPPKFIKIKELLASRAGQVAVYSNYEEHGFKAFANFLNKTKYKNSYVSLRPDESVNEQVKKINLYNEGKKRIIIIHPEITEGLSLKGTETFHILEPIANASLLKQITGRAIRFKSHSHLPENLLLDTQSKKNHKF